MNFTPNLSAIMVRGGLRGGPRLRGSFKKASFSKLTLNSHFYALFRQIDNRSNHSIFAVPRHPFDLSVSENTVFFPRVTPVKDDAPLLAALTKRNQELTP